MSGVGSLGIKTTFVVIKRCDGDGSAIVHGLFEDLEDAQIYAGEWKTDSGGSPDIEIATIDEFDQKRFDSAEDRHYDQLSIGFGEESGLVIG